MKYTVTHTLKVKFYYNNVNVENKEDVLEKVRAIAQLEWDPREVDFADD